MQRQFKFRFWSKVLEAFVTPHDSIYRGAFNDPEFVVMQYTNLKDKNGKEIYEGDIVINRNPQFPFEVKWSQDKARFIKLSLTRPRRFQSLGDTTKTEVIGNIYEKKGE